MKYQFILTLITFITYNSYTQVTFEKGYYISNDGNKIECLIKNSDWKSNPTKIEFKYDIDSESDTASILNVKEFEIYDASKYVRKIIPIDRSSSTVNKLSDIQSPIFKEEKLFLKVLVEGKASLYSYRSGSLARYFYTVDNSKIEQLVYKKYRTSKNKIKKNNQYRQQLLKLMQCSPESVERILKLDYVKKQLLNYFIEFNECNNSNSVIFDTNDNKDLFNLTFRPRLNSSSLKQVYSGYIRNLNVGTALSLAFGIEAEYILPYYSNKWAIAIEPTYQRYVTMKANEVDYVLGGKIVTDVKYNSIEIPFSFRHYIFLSNDSKLFINASFVTDIAFNSFIELKGNKNSTINYLDIKTRWNFAYGIGYKMYDRFGVELRYQSSRELLVNKPGSSSRFNTVSMIFGYSIL